jgi:DNA-binding transcriptional MerR regulator
MAAKKKNSGKQHAEQILIPDKLYFRIGEVASLCRLPAYVLRFWESEFPQLKQLLYQQGFTISGARQQLRAEVKSDKSQTAIPFPTQAAPEIQHIRQGLREILDLLSARRTG